MLRIRSSWSFFVLIALAFAVEGCGKESGPRDLDDIGAIEKSRPSEWALHQRLYPYGRAEARVYTEASEQIRRLSKSGIDLGTGPWQFVGPDRVAGRVVDIAYNPRSPDSVYAAAATGGVFLSADGGRSWVPIFDEQPVLSIGDIAVDPSDPSTIYVGTGEANGGHNNLPGAGLFKSTDGGATWRPSGLESAVSIGRIVVDPTRPERLFAAVVGSYFAPGAERGVYRSDDAGESWTPILSTGEDVGAIDLVIHPTRPDTLYAAMWQRVRTYDSISLSGPESGVYRSYDGGNSWTRLGESAGLPEGSGIGRIGLTICESQPDVLYALFNDGYEYIGTYRTDDGGDEWRNVDPAKEVRFATSNFSWYFGQIRVNPIDPDDVYVLDVRLARSRNGGQSWAPTAAPLHVDFHALEFKPGEPSEILVGNDGGIGISLDAAASWEEILDLPITQFYAVAVDRQNENRIIGGTQDNGSVMRNPQNGLWSNLLQGDGFAPLIHPVHPETVYVQVQRGGLRKSVDGGTSFVSVVGDARGIPSSDPRNWSTPVVMDLLNPEVLYYGTNRVYRSDNGGASWAAISPVLPLASLSSPTFGTVTAIEVSGVNSSVVWAGTDDGRVWLTSDPKVEWRDVTTGLPERWVTDLAADPQDEMTAYVTFSGLKWRDPQPHVFRTVDGGASWDDVSSNLPDIPVNSIIIDPDDPSMLFVGTDLGVFGSADGGRSWAPLAEGMPMVAVYDLDIHEETRTLFASTHGRSIFRAQLAGSTVSVERPVRDGIRLESDRLEAWPNPFRRHVNLKLGSTDLTDERRYFLEGSGGRVDVFDARGRRVRSLGSIGDRQVAGSGSTIRWDGRLADGRDAVPGMYFVRVGSEITRTVVFAGR